MASSCCPPLPVEELAGHQPFLICLIFSASPYSRATVNKAYWAHNRFDNQDGLDCISELPDYIWSHSTCYGLSECFDRTYFFRPNILNFTCGQRHWSWLIVFLIKGKHGRLYSLMHLTRGTHPLDFCVLSGDYFHLCTGEIWLPISFCVIGSTSITTLQISHVCSGQAC